MITSYNFELALKWELEARQISQSNLGRTLGVSNGYISRLCSGDRQPSADMAIKIANALNLEAHARIQFLSFAGFIEEPLPFSHALTLDNMRHYDQQRQGR